MRIHLSNNSLELFSDTELIQYGRMGYLFGTSENIQALYAIVDKDILQIRNGKLY